MRSEAKRPAGLLCSSTPHASLLTRSATSETDASRRQCRRPWDCWPAAAGFRSPSPRRPATSACRWCAWRSAASRRRRNWPAGPAAFTGRAPHAIGRMIRLFKREGVEQLVMAGKVHKANLMHRPWKLLHPAARLADHQARGTSAGAATTATTRCCWVRHRRIRPRRPAVRVGPDPLPGAARASRHSDAPSAHGPRGSRHRLRLGAGQGNGPARRRPKRGRQGAGRAGRRGHRRHRPGHPPRRRAVPGGRLRRRQGRQAAAGHALRRADHRPHHHRDACTRPAAASWPSRPDRTIVLDQAETVALADRYGITIVALAVPRAA